MSCNFDYSELRPTLPARTSIHKHLILLIFFTGLHGMILALYTFEQPTWGNLMKRFLMKNTVFMTTMCAAMLCSSLAISGRVVEPTPIAVVPLINQPFTPVANIDKLKEIQAKLDAQLKTPCVNTIDNGAALFINSESKQRSLNIESTKIDIVNGIKLACFGVNTINYYDYVTNIENNSGSLLIIDGLKLQINPAPTTLLKISGNNPVILRNIQITSTEGVAEVGLSIEGNNHVVMNSVISGGLIGIKINGNNNRIIDHNTVKLTGIQENISEDSIGIVISSGNNNKIEDNSGRNLNGYGVQGFFTGLKINGSTNIVKNNSVSNLRWIDNSKGINIYGGKHEISGNTVTNYSDAITANLNSTTYIVNIKDNIINNSSKGIRISNESLDSLNVKMNVGQRMITKSSDAKSELYKSTNNYPYIPIDSYVLRRCESTIDIDASENDSTRETIRVCDLDDEGNVFTELLYILPNDACNRTNNSAYLYEYIKNESTPIMKAQLTGGCTISRLSEEIRNVDERYPDNINIIPSDSCAVQCTNLNIPISSEIELTLVHQDTIATLPFDLSKIDVLSIITTPREVVSMTPIEAPSIGGNSGMDGYVPENPFDGASGSNADPLNNDDTTVVGAGSGSIAGANGNSGGLMIAPGGVGSAGCSLILH